jgi:Ferritin-like domain
MLPLRATRRELVSGVAAAIVAAGAGAGAAASSALADTPAPSDVELLTNSLMVERLMVLAYQKVLSSRLLPADLQRVIEPHLGHERAHVAALAGRLRSLGAPAPTGPLDLKTAAATMGQYHVSDSLTDLHTQNECLKLLVDLESVAEGIHYTALKDLRSPPLQRLSAQVMACEAQHWTVLSGLRNPGEYVKSIPWPFVYGSK